MNFGGGNSGGSDTYLVLMYEDKEASVPREAYGDSLKSITSSQIYPSASPLHYHLVSSDAYLALK